MKWEDLAPNYFDIVVVVVLVIGLIRGRKRGMSQELLDVLQWLIIVVAGALVYKPLGGYLAAYTHLSLLSSYMICYVSFGLFVKLFFTFLKRAVGEKLVGSDVFGRLEYYLGMLAGVFRFSCIVFVGLALLNAVYISPAQLAAEAKMQRDNFGSISFPTLGSFQQTVFAESFTGRTVKKHLSDQLIEPSAGGKALQNREGPGKNLQRSLDELTK